MASFNDAVNTLSMLNILQRVFIQNDHVRNVTFFNRADIIGYVTQLLERLSLSFEEFLYLHDGIGPDQMELFFNNADEAYINRDLKQLKALRKIALDKWETHGMEAFRCNTLTLDVYESIIRGELTTSGEDALDFLYDYLFKVEIW